MAKLGFKRCARLWLSKLLEQLSIRICEWPGELRLVFSKNSGRFEAEWTLFKRGQVELPGSVEDLWPINVKTSKGGLLVVNKKEGRPVVDLPKGRTVVSGQFEWRLPPTRLSLPEGSALIDFSYNGRKVNFPEFDPENRLVLKQKSQEKGQRHPGHRDHLNFEEFRESLLTGKSDTLDIDDTKIIEIETTNFDQVDLSEVMAYLKNNLQ